MKPRPRMDPKAGLNDRISTGLLRLTPSISNSGLCR